MTWIHVFLLIVCIINLFGCIHSYGNTRDREGFFNRTASVRLPNPLSLQHHIGFSFKTCSGGLVFSQTSQFNKNQISLDVRSDGILLSIIYANRLYETKLSGNFLDGVWHDVAIINRLGNITISANGYQQVIANNSFNPELISSELSDKNSKVTVGDGFVGCILEGPSIILNSTLNFATNVEWGPCPISTNNCGVSHVDRCATVPCMMHGTCISLSDKYHCVCATRYSGNNCESDNGEICTNGIGPCVRGRCEEDKMGNYQCVCNNGFAGLHCDIEMKWACQNNPCMNKGKCVALQTVDTGFECLCVPGYTGKYCETNINECLSGPCMNGGICVDGVNNYTCLCSGTGYTGDRCSVNVNECETKPCLNRGKCFDNYSGYSCQCESGYAGQNCEINLDECITFPCKNGGSCRDTLGSFECVCPAGFTGRTCQVDLNGCQDSNSCPANSVCTNDQGNRRCVCNAGFTGVPPNCTQVTICSSSPCANGGICAVNGDGDFTCTCPARYTGKYCKTSVAYCASAPCLHGGICVEEANGFKCNCTGDFMGPLCQFDYSVCAFAPCRNNGKCVTEVGMSKDEYYCECPRGFDGPNCEQNIDDCAGVSCLPPKVCYDLVDGYECRCPEGVTGDMCSLASFVQRCNNQLCRNNSTCVDGPNGMGCKCLDGFTGADCGTDIDECEMNVCKNGFCVNLPGLYQCFCTPGFTGDHCEVDVDECLSNPCRNGASCINGINKFTCLCAPGYTGKDCSTDINECASDPCQHGGTCLDGKAMFTCVCPVGLTGTVCETDIDDCVNAPCLNEGKCIDGINSYSCDCSQTGFFGDHCEVNIDECADNECVNNGTCVDLVKDYHCDCYNGYAGKNCEIDINECETNPCQYGGICLERSNVTLYNSGYRPIWNATLPEIYSGEFSYSRASGYDCICLAGLTGTNCEININDCEPNPCRFGKCNDEIGGYACVCDEGFEGVHCELDIDECERYKPCVNGNCIDRRANYYCECTAKYGGKNCSVELTGCNTDDLPLCKNNGTCKPYLIGESLHTFNCTCQNGFFGATCENITTMSLTGESHLMVNTSRDEGYDISFYFKTTLPRGLLAMGKGSTYYILELSDGRLNLHSSLLNKWEGVFVGSQLNDSTWQKVFVAINSSHVVLAANEEQTIYPITINEAASANHTSFPTTFVGGTIPNLRSLVNGPPVFIGCTENVIINGQWVIPNEASAEETPGVEIGCSRKDQCRPNPCHSGGLCTDLWKNFSCACQRPYLGFTCQYNLTAATFGHEDIKNSLVTVVSSPQTRKGVRNMVDISMFIRTRQSKGFIFYLGSVPPHSGRFDEETFIAAELEGGELLVRIQFNATLESYTVGGVKINDGRNHLIQVVRNITLVQVKINGTEYFRKTISSSGPLDAQVLYLGGIPFRGASPDIDSANLGSRTIRKAQNDFGSGETQILRSIRQTNDVLTNSPYYKGIIQDVQLSNGSHTMVVEFFPLIASDVVLPKPFGNVSFDSTAVLEGVLSDNTCLSNPCKNAGTCVVTWNDFKCFCTRGHKGKQCEEIEFCQLQECPVGSECRNLNYGYECVANITLSGEKSSSLKYTLNRTIESTNSYNMMELLYRSQTGGTLLYICNDNNPSLATHFYFTMSVYKDEVLVAWKLDSSTKQEKIRKEHQDGEWTQILTKITDNKMHVSFAGASDELGQYFIVSNFSSAALNKLISTGIIYIGGVDSFLHENMLVGKQGYDADNSVEHSSLMDSDQIADHRALGNHISMGAFYKGCIGEVRIGGLLLPYFTTNQLNYSNAAGKDYFMLEGSTALEDHGNLGCFLCFDQNCKNGGRCEDVRESYVCDCPVGYAGEDCSENIDECVDNECANGATCVDGVANYTCDCIKGWTGWHCDVEIDECESQPCENNGMCKNLLGDFSCECPEQYMGKQCELLKRINCASGYCKNGARCSDMPNKSTGENFTCYCLEGFSGTYCSDLFCKLTPCKHNGVCKIQNKVPICDCPAGYRGQYCEENIDDCALSYGTPPCFHNGICIDDINNYYCNCSGTGYTGSRCDIDINECKEGLTDCGEKGECINEEGSYHCQCEQNFCGHRCNLPNPCLEMPCVNGGTCREQCTDYADYECSCTSSYGGKNCFEASLYLASKVGDVLLIVGPILVLLIGAAIVLVFFTVMARNKRATRGTYSPSSEEYFNPRVELDNVLKPPPEERLI